jgi:hypothetical protein
MSSSDMNSGTRKRALTGGHDLLACRCSLLASLPDREIMRLVPADSDRLDCSVGLRVDAHNDHILGRGVHAVVAGDPDAPGADHQVAGIVDPDRDRRPDHPVGLRSIRDTESSCQFPTQAAVASQTTTDNAAGYQQLIGSANRHLLGRRMWAVIGSAAPGDRARGGAALRCRRLVAVGLMVCPLVAAERSVG